MWFFGKFCCRGEVSGTWKSHSSTTHVPLSSRREVSGAWNSQSWTLNTIDLNGASLTRWTNVSQNDIDEAVGQNSSFDKRKPILIILSSRCASVVRWAVPQTTKVQQCMCHYCPRRAKQLGDLCGPLRQRLSSCTATWFFAKFCCRGEVSGTWKSQSSTTHLPLLSYESKKDGLLAVCCANDSRAAFPKWIFCHIFAAVVRQVSRLVVKWAMRETARVQHWMCHCRFGELPSWGEQCLKQPKFNAGRLADRCANDSRAAPRREFFAKFCCCDEVSSTWQSQSSTTQLPLSSRRETSGAWNSQIWIPNISDLKRRLADTMDKHITKRHRRSCWSKL